MPIWPKLSLEELEADAVNWGNALNAAGWQFIKEWRNAFPSKQMPAVLFDNLKQFLRPAIRTYLLDVYKEAADAAGGDDAD